ncbi:hypothetical protein KGQ34_02715 [Patescibacteria group bacterium]|nr:hypothetical protein [Patescibacteria group bacterium]
MLDLAEILLGGSRNRRSWCLLRLIGKRTANPFLFRAEVSLTGFDMSVVPVPAGVKDGDNLPAVAINNRDTRVFFLDGNNSRLQIVASDLRENLVSALLPALFGEEKTNPSSVQAYSFLVAVLVRIRKPAFNHGAARNGHGGQFTDYRPTTDLPNTNSWIRHIHAAIRSDNLNSPKQCDHLLSFFRSHAEVILILSERTFERFISALPKNLFASFSEERARRNSPTLPPIYMNLSRVSVLPG